MKKMNKWTALFIGMCMVVSGVFGTTNLNAQAAEAAQTDTLLKAGSISVSETAVTEGQPFAAGTAGSDIFRIPCLITLDNGNLLAAADARYTEYRDFGGIDTIASVSTDDGATWNYSFPIYFPDSDGSADFGQATTAIDPAIVQGPDGTIYCLADMNPTGVTTLDVYPLVGTGYVTVDGVERLALTSVYANTTTLPTDADTTTYEYYVGDFDENGFAKVLNRADHSESVYAVDEWYNIYSVVNGEYVADLTQTQVDSTTVIQQNAFYKDSALHVYNTGYIWCVKSYDGGLSWEDPEILNPQVKRDDGQETALLVSPGQGMVTSDGDIIVGAYDTYGGENASIFYSTDNGETWNRSNDVNVTSSENEIVELPDGTLRMFYRSNTMKLCYADIVKNTDGTYTVGTGNEISITVSSNCNVSAILLEDTTIDGKPVILASNPEGPGSWNRVKGRIFVFTLNEDNTMNHEYTFPVNEETFAYSCMTEMDNGNIAMLWEPGINQASAIRYDEFDIREVLGTIQNLELSLGESYSIEEAGESGLQITQTPDEEIVEITRKVEKEDSVIVLHNHIANSSSSVENSFSATADDTMLLHDAEFTFIASGSNWKIYNEAKNLYLTNVTSANTFFSETEGEMLVTASTEEEGKFTICRSTGSRYIIFYNNNMDFNSNGSFTANYTGGSYNLMLLEKQAEVSADDVVPGYKQVTEITDGHKYVIAHTWSDGSVFVLYPANGTADQTKLVGDVKDITNTTVTMTAVGVGETTAVVGDITYNITVPDPTDDPAYAENDYTGTITYTAGSVENIEGVEGPIALAFDGETTTYWHSEWSPSWSTSELEDYLWVEFELEGATMVDAIRYLPRPAGSRNGDITGYRIEGTTDGTTWTTLTTGTWTSDGQNWKLAEFTPTEVTGLRLVATSTYADSGNNKFASAAELRVRTYVENDDDEDNSGETFDKTIELNVGETYTEELTAGTAVSSENEGIATAVTETFSQTFYGLCDYNSTAVNEALSFEKAEMTFIAGEGENSWKIYNENLNKYFINSKASNGVVTLFQDAECEVSVIPDANVEGSFLISNDTRYIIFYGSDKNMNGMSSYNGAQDDAFFYELDLLEKQDTEAETDVVPGYAKVSEITSGEKYLISYTYDGTVYVLDPTTLSSTDMWNSITKSVGTYEEATATLTITGVEEGRTTVRVGESVYEVVVTENTVVMEVCEVFPDVTHGAWYEEGVQYVYDHGIMSGNNGLFNPTGNVTRAQVVATLYKLEGSPAVTDYSAVDDLVDVQADQWYTDAVCWAYSVEVANGNSTTKMFNMSNPVTRQQLATFFYNYAKHKGLDITTRGDYSDLIGAEEVADYAADTMQWAYGTGLITGSAVKDADGNTVYDLKPTGTATRAQMAAILQRFCENNDL